MPQLPKLQADALVQTTGSSGKAPAAGKKNAYRPCGCYVMTGPSEITVGCGQHTKSRFAMGHDAKTKSVLQHMFRVNGPDSEVTLIVGDISITKSIELAFSDLGWLQFMTDGKVNKARSAQFTDATVDLPEDEVESAAAPAQPVTAPTDAVTETTKTRSRTPRAAGRRTRSAA